jgi:hypothetical protein
MACLADMFESVVSDVENAWTVSAPAEMVWFVWQIV